MGAVLLAGWLADGWGMSVGLILIGQNKQQLWIIINKNVTNYNSRGGQVQTGSERWRHSLTILQWDKTASSGEGRGGGRLMGSKTKTTERNWPPVPHRCNQHQSINQGISSKCLKLQSLSQYPVFLRWTSLTTLRSHMNKNIHFLLRLQCMASVHGTNMYLS